MRLYLDDIRNAPPGWTITRNARECMGLLALGEVTHLSLDHDLGEDLTGYDVLLWIEERVAFGGFAPPEIEIHTDNAGARPKMLQAVETIERMRRAREEVSR